MKTKEELNELKDEMKITGKKLAELSDEELQKVAGGDFTKYTSYSTCSLWVGQLSTIY